MCASTGLGDYPFTDGPYKDNLAQLVGGDQSRILVLYELIYSRKLLPYVGKPAYCRVSLQCQDATVCSPIFTKVRAALCYGLAVVYGWRSASISSAVCMSPLAASKQIRRLPQQLPG